MTWHHEWHGGWHHDWHGVAVDPSLIPPYGDDGVATIVLELEAGYKVTHRWITDVIKFQAGKEQRIGRNQIDRESYEGLAFLINDQPREVRADLAAYASIGAVFLLALQHEAIALRANAAGASVPVFAGDLLLSDWATRGQRVVVVSLDAAGELQSVKGVVQDTTADTIVLDVAPGAVGKYGGWIMPVKHVLLEPQQNLPRHEGEVESWELRARGAVPLDYAPTLAEVGLGSLSAPFANAVATVRLFGAIGSTLTLEFNGNAGWPAAGQLIETGPLTLFRYRPGVTTLQNLYDALQLSTNFLLTGAWNPAHTFSVGDDIFATAFGGTDIGSAGKGAVLTTYNGDGIVRPVWHRELAVDGAIADGAHAMTKLLDYGGKPYALGTADQPDWYRTVAIRSGSKADEQWLRLFIATVRANQRKFWVPTWRKDLSYVGHAGASMTIDDVNFAAWWPRLREHVQIEQADGVITYAKIDDAVNNGNGTRTLTLSVALSATAVTRVGWLELCRFETADEFQTIHTTNGFDVSLTARVVP